MIDWYVEILEGSPDDFKNDNYLNSVIKTTAPCMDYFCKRLIEIDNFNLQEMEVIF